MWRIYSSGAVVEVGLFQQKHKEVLFGNGTAYPDACFRSLRREVMPFLRVVGGIKWMP